MCLISPRERKLEGRDGYIESLPFRDSGVLPLFGIMMNEPREIIASLEYIVRNEAGTYNTLWTVFISESVFFYGSLWNSSTGFTILKNDYRPEHLII